MTTSPAVTPAAPAPATTRFAGLLPTDDLLRRLSLFTLLNAFGRGLFFPVSVLYFTRVIGLSATSVGLGLTVAGLFGIAAGVPAGRASDLWGRRPVLGVLWVGCGAALAAYTVIGSYAAFLVTAIAYAALCQGSMGVRNALYADVLPAGARVEGRAHLRMVTNVGMGVGGVFGALALQVDSRAGYTVLILVDAVMFMASAALVLRLPESTGRSSTVAAPAGSRWRAVRDLPFLAVTFLNAVLALQYSLLEVGLPLWIAQHTEAPRWSAALIMVLNCVLVALFQVRATRGVEDLPGAVRAMRRAGLLLALSCAVFAATAGLSPWWALGVLVVGAVVQVLAEVLSAAGGWTVGYGLADSRAQGVYQGVFNSGQAAATMAAPALVTATAIRHGATGWVILAALFVVAGLGVGPAVRWARRDGEWRGE
ncbi:MFS transporter [Streptomyces sp. VRA16 Mangrove soil]|uniref:MFS transporter n=1 Tax=Streptomyces sp. VRA16 Mangrove soil TaxID=2817434 RepID=UPI001A9EE5BA|nr:MFS transporter [Streptomyces sp. VRA16 Mangrove soil]MBO1335482.1 MFS transporter [Streptomyces sp. VRA16 Mangrove soil]